jgi:hypothetical protein
MALAMNGMDATTGKALSALRIWRSGSVTF